MNDELLQDEELLSESMNEQQLKKINQTYLYQVSTTYEQQITNAILHAERLDVTESAFDAVKYGVSTRQPAAVITRILTNPDIIYLFPSTPMPKALKVFTARDIKGDKNMKVFIDASGIFRKNTGETAYRVFNIDQLISYLMSAMVKLIYNIEPQRFIGNSVIMNTSCECFAKLFTYIVDYLYKISNTDISNQMCLHIAAMYYQVNIMRRSMDQQLTTIHQLASKISKLDQRKADIVQMYIEEDSFLNIKEFIETVAKMLKLNKLTLDTYISKWLMVYGTGSQLGLEYFPSFSDILTHTFNGSYIFNQKSIENILGSDINTYSTQVLNIGGSCL